MRFFFACIFPFRFYGIRAKLPLNGLYTGKGNFGGHFVLMAKKSFVDIGHYVILDSSILTKLEDVNYHHNPPPAYCRSSKKAKLIDKDYDLSDGHGLTLSVRTTGKKIWRFRY